MKRISRKKKACFYGPRVKAIHSKTIYCTYVVYMPQVFYCSSIEKHLIAIATATLHAVFKRLLHHCSRHTEKTLTSLSHFKVCHFTKV